MSSGAVAGKNAKRGLEDIGNAAPCALYEQLCTLSSVAEAGRIAILASEDAEGLKAAKKKALESLEPCKSLAAAAKSAVTELKRAIALVQSGKLRKKKAGHNSKKANSAPRRDPKITEL